MGNPEFRTLGGWGFWALVSSERALSVNLRSFVKFSLGSIKKVELVRCEPWIQTGNSCELLFGLVVGVGFFGHLRFPDADFVSGREGKS